MEQAILKQLRWLKIYALVSTLVFAALLALVSYRSSRPPHFAELAVERLNIVEKDGTLRMVLSNAARQHPGIVAGKPLPARPRPAGLLFFNTEGDECGGLVYDGTQQQASLDLSVDQYQNDQVMQLQYSEKRGGAQPLRSYGLRLWDRPTNFTLGQLVRQLDSLQLLHSSARYAQGLADLKAKHLLGEERLFLGKNTQEETGLFIRDNLGRPRIQLYVDAKGAARLEVLDAAGHKMPVR